MNESINWSHHDLDGLEQLYWDEIAPALRRDGRDPHTRPSHQTLADLGYAGIAYTLREHHGLTLKQFFMSVVDLDDPTASAATDGYYWDIGHEETRDELESYVRILDRRQNLAESTVSTKQSQLAKYARTYYDLHGTADLLGDLRDADARPAETDRCYAVLDVFDDELGSDAAKLKYLGTVRDWYDRLVARGKATYNPLEHADREFRWEREEPDNQPLTAPDVRSLYETADSLEDRLLVVALAGWGLRSGEVARLHQRQFIGLDSDDPHLAFDERKNGPSEVTILYGVDVLADRLDELANRSEWNGYLFPSRQSDSGYIHPDTVRRRFRRLCEDAGVGVDAGKTKPHAARRFWYSTYRDAVGNLLSDLEGIAADQGSASAEVVARNYLSEEEIRHARREAMREALAEAFGDSLATSSNG